MNPRDHEKLLQEILQPEDMVGYRKSSLEHGLAGLRRERRRRHLVRFSALAVVLLGLSLGVLFSSRKLAPQEHVAAHPPPQPAPSHLASSHIEFISDEQLLEQLRAYTNRTAALIGKPGDQRVVYLDKSDDRSEQDPN